MFIHFLLAMLPIIWLIIALSGLKMAGHVACPIALIITVIEALFLWKQKIIDVLTGGLEGFAMAIWPICLVIVAAVFTYNLVVHTKNMELIKKMLTSVREAVQAGIPYMAECGGFMYLHQEMEDMEGHSWPMAGVIPGKSWRTPRLSYITLKQNQGISHGKQETAILGESDLGVSPAHEFHYFDSDNCGESYTARKPLSSRSWNCIHSDRQGMSGFPHMYYYSNLQVPEQFLRTCEERKA